MKISKIAALAKKERSIGIFTANGMQWAGLRSAVYPLYGIPDIRDPEELLSIFDVPADERDSWKVTFGQCDLPDEMCIRELSAQETVIRPLPFGFVFGGDDITVFESGAMVKTKFLSPCDRIGTVTVGRGFVRVFDGALLCGAVCQYVPTVQMLDEVIPYLGYLEHIREQMRYEEQMRIEEEEG